METDNGSILFTLFVCILICLLIIQYVRLEKAMPSNNYVFKTPKPKPMTKQHRPQSLDFRSNISDSESIPITTQIKGWGRGYSHSSHSFISINGSPFRASKLSGSFEIDSYLKAAKPTFYTNNVNNYFT